MHCVFMFTHAWGLSSDLAVRVGTPPTTLPPLSPAERRKLEQQVSAIYQVAYGSNGADLQPAERNRIDQHLNAQDVRLFLRTLVAALDHQRYRHLRS
jgi:hypothetical protein